MFNQHGTQIVRDANRRASPKTTVTRIIRNTEYANADPTPDPRHSWLIWIEIGTFAGRYSSTEATNSPRLDANTSAVAAASAGAISGAIILRKQYHRDPPNVRAASISDASNCVTDAVAIRVHNGRNRTK